MVASGMSLIVYTAQGDRFAKWLWQETMDELSVAGFEGIIESLGK